MHVIVFVLIGAALLIPGAVLLWQWRVDWVASLVGFVAGFLVTVLVLELLVGSSTFIDLASWLIRHRLLTGGVIAFVVVTYSAILISADIERWHEIAETLTRIGAATLGVFGGVLLSVVVLVGATWAERYHQAVGVDTSVPTVREHFTHYVALGDSYSAGEGLRPYLAGAGDPPAGDDCHRSPLAYSQQIPFDQPLTALAFRACSGALSGDVFDFAQNVTLGAQVSPGLLNPSTDLITLTMGGNDMHFSGVLQFCARTTRCLTRTFDPGPALVAEVGRVGPEPLARWVGDMLEVLRGRLDRLFTKLRQDAPNARIVVLGYPRLLPVGEVPRQFDSCDVLLQAFDSSERTGLSTLEARLNQMIFDTAAHSNVEFIDPTSDFSSHEACGVRGEMINNLQFGNGNQTITVDRGSFHPRAQGQRVFAREIACYLNEYPARPDLAKIVSAPGTPENPITC